ncbi:MAG: helix-turn-helix transcriptional regulator [Planctomycetes bacterium]|nr:helix-turn-helix transcriptional regulator [Planctomycetota bacterium]
MRHERTKTLIDYVIKHTDLNQAELARKLKVSRAQISKWKSGDHVSMDRTTQLLKLAGLFDAVNVEWAMFAKTEANAQAWYAYIQQIQEDVEWGDSLKDFIADEPEIYVGHLIVDLCNLGASIEQAAPTTRWIDEEDCEPTPLASVFYSVLEIWGQLKDWIDCTLNFDDLMDDAECELFDVTCELEWLAFDLALDYVETERLTAIGVEVERLDELIKESRQKIKLYLHDICQIRTKHGLPITENYFQLLYLSPVNLTEQAWFRPGGITGRNEENLIKSYLPYGQRLILSHLECSAIALRHIDEKLEQLVGKADA